MVTWAALPQPGVAAVSMAEGFTRRSHYPQNPVGSRSVTSPRFPASLWRCGVSVPERVHRLGVLVIVGEGLKPEGVFDGAHQVVMVVVGVVDEWARLHPGGPGPR